ncbi:MAG: cytochrome c biogenesis protein ResB [Bdellovibrionaceae bacterium]|nr:cytochrome c biogenesis protein ResB [Bdellovibrio sp.]
MASIAILIAWGTIVESQYDAFAAKKIVFDSWMMWAILSLLVYNLTVVVIDRWPWKLNHYPFITVHAGIIVIIFGGFITYKYGLDGQISVGINGKNNFISVPQTDLVVYATFDGDRYSKIVDREVDFFNNPPTKEKPFKVELGEDQIEVIEYVKYARLQAKVKATEEPLAGASVRFQLMNANVKQVQQITQTKKDKEATFNLGPAQVFLGAVREAKTGGRGNEIFLTPYDADHLKYTIFHRQIKKPFKTGTIKIGDVVATGWMGLELRLLDFLPKAVEEFEVTPFERPTPLTSSAIRIRNQNVEKWLVLNDVVKIFRNSTAYLLSYQNRRLDLGFPIFLKKFDVIRYQGTKKAMEYASLVRVGDESPAQIPVEQLISMNEPLKFNGYTIYQASFQEDEVTGEPTASVFSVNKDPGRPIKYLGSLIFSLGIVWLFYQRRKRRTAV